MKTLENLIKAFMGESMARNRYTFYAKIAKEEGYVFISKVFLKIAENEKEHAETLFELIQNLGSRKDLSLGDTVENLKSAIEGESYESMKMYPEFAKVAEEEGMKEVAKRLRAIAKAEEHHERIYRTLLDVLERGRYFRRDEEIEWICLECGYVHKGFEPPEVCPSCGHTKDYYVASDLLIL